MENYDQQFQQEAGYLYRVSELISRRLEGEELSMLAEKHKLTELNRQMWANTVHFSEDFDKLLEANQQLGDIESRTVGCQLMAERVRRFQKMEKSPYFARIDFAEDGYDVEPIYIGLGSLTDEEGLDVYVYDWRAPICSLFYRCEPGRVSYQAPMGQLSGEMNLKRQYEIKNATLQYFFDSDVSVMDDMLRSALSKNAAPQMRTIVETIQREQDTIIRDMESDLLMVQGVAGSGKTSVALHRVAFLMYQGLTGGLKADNLIILSPNTLFGQYIAGVLPDLGEENVATLMFEDLFHRLFGASVELTTRTATLEQLMQEESGTQQKQNLLRASLDFQLSDVFAQLLERLCKRLEETLPFAEVVYNEQCLATPEELRAQLAQRRVNMPVAKRLRVMEERLLDQVHRLKKQRLTQIEKLVRTQPEHQLEVRAQTRLISIREITALAHHIRSFTRVDVQTVYRTLFANREAFFRLAEGLPLPENAADLFDTIAARLKGGELGYADGMALLYLRVLLTGAREDSSIRQVVVDEAQDYYPLHYRILAGLLPNARYTILGDVGQTIARDASMTMYEEVSQVLNKKKSTLAVLQKSFRCSSEITAFSRRFLPQEERAEVFERHDQPPSIHAVAAGVDDTAQVAADINACMAEGFGTAAVLCKSRAQARRLAAQLRACGVAAQLADENTQKLGPGVYVLPIYLAKGLEFDTVFLCGADAAHYHTVDDRRLLYVATTRALHRLHIYYAGQPSPWLQPSDGQSSLTSPPTDAKI